MKAIITLGMPSKAKCLLIRDSANRINETEYNIVLDLIDLHDEDYPWISDFMEDNNNIVLNFYSLSYNQRMELYNFLNKRGYKIELEFIIEPNYDSRHHKVYQELISEQPNLIKESNKFKGIK